MSHPGNVGELQLPSLLAKKFSVASRDRGDKYFRGQRVKIRTGSATEVAGQVQGSELYNVTLKWSTGTLAVWCECPYFEDQGVACKHLWATILAAAERGHLSEMPAAGKVHLDTSMLFNQSSEDEPVEAEITNGNQVSAASDQIHLIQQSNEIRREPARFLCRHGRRS